MHQIEKGVVEIYCCVTCGMPHAVVSMNLGTVPEAVVCKRCANSFAKVIENLLIFFMKTKITNLKAVFCWYRPTLEEFLTLKLPIQDFVRKGGLLWGRFGEPKFIRDPTLEQITKYDGDFSKCVESMYPISEGNKN